MHKIWSGIGELISLKSGKSASPISISITKTEISSDPDEVSNCFNDYFTSIADSIWKNIPPTPHHFSRFLRNRNPNSMFLTPTTVDEVIKVISSFSPSKSSGPNSIPIKILKLFKHELSYPILIL